MKATASIEGEKGRVEMSVEVEGTFKTADGDCAVLRELGNQVRLSYQKLGGDPK